MWTSDYPTTSEVGKSEVLALLTVRRPSSVRGPACSLAALLGRHLGRARLPALETALASQRNRRRVLSGILRGRVLGLARGDVYDQLGELVGVAGTFA
jgi:hypothetical protein